jgi:hypothetical protein
MPSLTVVTPPAVEPVDLVTLKNHLRVTISEDNAIIGIYGQAARELVESESGRSLVNKGYCQSHDHFPHRHDYTDRGTGYFYSEPRYASHHLDPHQAIKLLRCPLVYVDRIEYIDVNGDVQTLLPTPELWQPKTEYVKGDQVQDANGNLQQVSAVTDADEDGTSESGAAVTTWSASLSTTTADAGLTWTCIKIPAPTGDFLVDRDSEPPIVAPLFGQVWPVTLRVPQAVKVFFTAGYGDDASAAPATLKVALMQSTGVMYENREALTAEQLRALDWYDRLIFCQRVTDYAPTK